MREFATIEAAVVVPVEQGRQALLRQFRRSVRRAILAGTLRHHGARKESKNENENKWHQSSHGNLSIRLPRSGKPNVDDHHSTHGGPADFSDTPGRGL
jgi:hypothetical protein